MFINRNYLTSGTLRHEILHAIVAESHIESSNLNPLQIEELCCTILDFQWYNINNWVEQILNEFLKPRNKESEE